MVATPCCLFCLCLSVCLSVCLSLSLLCVCVCLCLRVSVSSISLYSLVAFSGVRTCNPGLRPVPHSIKDPNPFDSARSPRETKISTCPTSRAGHLLVYLLESCSQSGLVTVWRQEGVRPLIQAPLSSKQNAHREEETLLPVRIRSTLSDLSNPGEGESSPG